LPPITSWLKAIWAELRSSAIAMNANRATVDYRLFGVYRLLLAWLVLTSHSNHYLPDWVGPLALGNVGVFCFFVLSGFVIAEACDRFYAGAPHRFLLNRLLRIYPTYWMTCLVALAIYLAAGHPELGFDAVSVAANLSILYSPQGVLFWISLVWAVGIELRFYFVAALMELTRMLFKRRSASVYAAFWLGALALYLTTVGLDYQRLATFRHAPYFMLGMAMYHAVARRSGAGALAAAIGLPFAVHAYWTYSAAGSTDPLPSTLLFLAMLAAMLAASLATVSAPAARIDKALGDFTYPLYLVHWPVVWLIGRLLSGAGLEGYAAVVFASSLAAALVLLLEQPLTRLRDEVRGKRLYA
jgi:peptidoglycan/LPS O-acetylase OafA/YrhL